jgi:hypothetical protein
MNTIHHALVLNFHQPASNLEKLLDQESWEPREILYALDRIPRSLWGYEDTARVHLSLSGTLLETISNPEFQKRAYGFVKLGDLLWYLQNTDIFDVLGTGYYHPVFPLTPKADWNEQLVRWHNISAHLFNRTDFSGFWPPEMSFCMEMIPAMKKLGYRYVLVDSQNVEPVDEMSWHELRYQPHIAEYDGEEIIVIVRDRELSAAQESGFDPDWFMYEIHARSQYCDFPPLVTTASDGNNGGWFRNTAEQGNFWGVFYRPLLDQVRTGETNVKPTFIKDYLDKHGAKGRVKIKTASWNTGWYSGEGFTQWKGSPLQQDGLRRLEAVSADWHDLYKVYAAAPSTHEEALHHLEDARWRILRAETSCNFFWGEEWVARAHQDLDEALRAIGRAKASA